MQTLELNKRRIYYSNCRKNKYRGDYNCWGATQFVLGFTDRLRWIWDESEMQRWLDMYAEKIYRPKKPGDILAIHETFFGHTYLRHTAVYLGDGKYFHKQGSAKADITTIQGIKDTYSGTCSFLRLK